MLLLLLFIVGVLLFVVVLLCCVLYLIWSVCVGARGSRIRTAHTARAAEFAQSPTLAACHRWLICMSVTLLRRMQLSD